MKKTNILNLTYYDFLELFKEYSGRGEYFAKPVYKQIMSMGEFSPEELDVFKKSPKILKIFKDYFKVELLQFKKTIQADQTEKIIFKTHDNYQIESVIIPMKSYKTLCISSQVGCAMKCSFCQTADMGFLRNLDVFEIISQLYWIKYIKKEPVRNVVFMGMGEPLDNFDNVMKAIDIFNDIYGFNLKHARITISTCGLIDKIDKLALKGSSTCSLAISLNAVTNNVRNSIMPVNKRFNLQLLKSSLLNYQKKVKRKILIEYVLIKDLNDSVKDAKALIQFLKGLDYKINLIPYNPKQGCDLQTPLFEKCEEFYRYILSKKIKVFNRISKGDKILAACGQLGSKNTDDNIFFN